MKSNNGAASKLVTILIFVAFGVVMGILFGGAFLECSRFWAR